MTSITTPDNPAISDIEHELDRLMQGRPPLGTAAVIADVMGYSKPHTLAILDNLGVCAVDLGPGTAYRYRLREAFRTMLTAPVVSIEQRRARTRAATQSRLGRLAQQSPENRELRARAVASAAAKKRGRKTSPSAATA